MTNIAPAYKSAKSFVLIQQAVVLLLAGMNLDGGDAFHFCLVALLAFWVGAVIICVRRPQTPTRSDLLFIRFGYLPLCILTGFFTMSFWRWKGIWK
jgi:hypothetical protein